MQIKNRRLFIKKKEQQKTLTSANEDRKIDIIAQSKIIIS
jgi:hypothetical protein